MSEMQNDVLELTLAAPIVIGSGSTEKTYACLTLREPTAGEFEKASLEKTSVGVVLTLIAAMSGLPRNVIEELCQRDLKDAAAFLERFSQLTEVVDELSDGDEFVYDLDPPIVLGAKGPQTTYSSLTLREPNARQIEKSELASTAIGQLITKVHLVAKVPRRVIEMLPLSTLLKVGHFLNSSRASGQ